MVRIWLAAVALVVLVTVFCAVDALTLNRLRIRALPRWVWVLIIVLLPIVGSILWMSVGRGRAARTVAPDDDPEFLRDLKKRFDDTTDGLGGPSRD